MRLSLPSGAIFHEVWRVVTGEEWGKLCFVHRTAHGETLGPSDAAVTFCYGDSKKGTKLANINLDGPLKYDSGIIPSESVVYSGTNDWRMKTVF